MGGADKPPLYPPGGLTPAALGRAGLAALPNYSPAMMFKIALIIAVVAFIGYNAG